MSSLRLQGILQPCKRHQEGLKEPLVIHNHSAGIKHGDEWRGVRRILVSLPNMGIEAKR